MFDGNLSFLEEYERNIEEEDKRRKEKEEWDNYYFDKGMDEHREREYENDL